MRGGAGSRWRRSPLDAECRQQGPASPCGRFTETYAPYGDLKRAAATSFHVQRLWIGENVARTGRTPTTASLHPASAPRRESLRLTAHRLLPVHSQLRQARFSAGLRRHSRSCTGSAPGLTRRSSRRLPRAGSERSALALPAIVWIPGATKVFASPRFFHCWPATGVVHRSEPTLPRGTADAASFT
jgi:hypothetical protein